MSFNPLDLIEKEEQYPANTIRRVVDPAVVYPATIARIQEVIAGSDPVEIIDSKLAPRKRYSTAAEFLKEFEKIPAEAWTLAMTPRGNWPDTEDLEKDSDKKTLALRARAIRLAWIYFKRATRSAVGDKSTFKWRIKKDPDWKRN